MLEKYLVQIRKSNPGLVPKNFTCHCIRHSRAMHLLQEGVNHFAGHVAAALEHVDPVQDGSRLPVTGRGQLAKVDRDRAPGEAFGELDDLL